MTYAHTRMPTRPNRIRPSRTTSRELGLTISAMSAASGISSPMLRIWEWRYGWPTARRGANGYRRYDPALLPVLLMVSRELERGRLIGNILADEQLDIRNAHRRQTTTSRQTWNFSAIAMPITSAGLKIRAKLEDAIACRDGGRIAQAQAEALRLPPKERQSAVDEILNLVATEISNDKAGSNQPESAPHGNCTA